MRGLGVYAFGARTTPNSLIEEEARWRDEGSWSLRLRGEDNTKFADWGRGEIAGWGVLGVYAFGARTTPIRWLRKMRDRGMRVLGVYAFGARTKKKFADWGRGEIEGWGVLGVYAFGARTTRVYPLMRSSGVCAFGARTTSIRWWRKRGDWGMGGSGVYAFGARTTPIRWLRKKWDRGRRGSWSIRLRGEDKKSLSADERFWGLCLQGENNINSLMKEEAGLRDGRFWGLRLRGEDKRVYPLIRGYGVCAFRGRATSIRWWRKRRDWGMGGSEDNTSSSEEAARGSGVYAFLLGIISKSNRMSDLRESDIPARWIWPEPWLEWSLILHTKCSGLFCVPLVLVTWFSIRFANSIYILSIDIK
jgi:hypothetical protein